MGIGSRKFQPFTEWPSVSVPLASCSPVGFRLSKRGASISVQVHRTRRFPFVAGVHVTALDREAEVAAHTEDLSLLGCSVQTVTPFTVGTKVSIRISHEGAVFVAQGRVAYAREFARMGIAFTSIEARSVAILDDWLTEQTN